MLEADGRRRYDGDVCFKGENMVIARLTAAALAGVSILVATAAFAADGKVREVTLSSGGLAEVVRDAQPGEDGTIRIDVPLSQVDDVLKSLVVRGGTVKGMSLAGPDALEEAFRNLPFGPRDLAELPSLLSSIQGTEVRVESGGRSVEGRILGVERRAGAEGSITALLSVVRPDGTIATLPLGSDSSAEILDESMRRKVAEAAAAAGRGKSGDTRTVEIEVGENGNGLISYVVAAPIWKAAHRIVVGDDGNARLQVWAVLENASGEDWRDVAITLSSGEPVTLVQRLHQRYWRERAEVPASTGPGGIPPVDEGSVRERATRLAMQDTAGMARADGHMTPFAPAMAEIASFGMAKAEESAVATESSVTSTYRLPGLHDLADGDTLSVPIADVDVEAEMVSLYRAWQGSQHPVAAVLLANPTGTSLPGGIVTVYGDSGYVGDARLASLPAGESRMASFATDTKVKVTQEGSPNRQVTAVKVVDGMARVTVMDREITAYTVTGAADEERTVVIEHPRREGWTFSSDHEDGATSTHHRLKAEVGAGDTVTVYALHEIARHESHSVSDAHPSMILGWASAADPETRQAFEKVAEARRVQYEAEQDISRLDVRIHDAVRAQSRIRENLAAVPAGGDLHARYLGDLAEREDEITALERAKEATARRLEAAGGALSDAVRSL